MLVIDVLLPHCLIPLISLCLQLEGVIGKRLSEQYGNEILITISDYLEEHPEDATDTDAGPWLAPKGKRVDEAPPKAPSTRQGKRLAEGPASGTTSKAPSTRQGKRVSENSAGAVKTPSIKDYMQTNVKADAESGPNVTAQQVAEGSGLGTTKTPTKRLSLKRPSVSTTPAPATRQEELKQDSNKIPQRNECIDLDSDSDQEEGQRPSSISKVKREVKSEVKNKVKREVNSDDETKDEIEETTSEEEDAFSLFKRVRRH